MGRSLLARGLNRLRRGRERQQKNAARQAYVHAMETLPVDPSLTVLEARNGRAIDGNIYYLLQVLVTDPAYRHLQIFVVTEDDEAELAMARKLAGMAGMPDDGRVRFVRLLSEEYYRAMATAGFIVNDATIGNFFVKREGQTYLNVWHGTPLKTMGRRVSHEPHAVGNAQKNFIAADYLLYPSSYMMEHMVEDYMLSDLSRARVLMGGYPRNVAFFDDGQRERIRRELMAEGIRRIYAYMPTWRPTLMGDHLQQILEQMEEALSPEEMMLVNVHPLAEEQVDLSRFRRIRSFPADHENYAVLNAADALLTDYSSVFYDYAVTGRGIVLLTPDEKEYLAVRGLYEPIDSLPFPRKKTAAEALEALRAPKAYDDRHFLIRYCGYESPRAAERLCRRVFLGEPCMEERKIPDNGRPNVLVWGGDLKPGPGREKVLEYLAEADPETANYYLTFNRGDLKDHYGILSELPAGIRYIGRAGKILLSAEEAETSGRYRRGKIGFEEYWKAVRPAFARQRQRLYADMRIDRIVLIPEGRDPGPGVSDEELEFSTYL